MTNKRNLVRWRRGGELRERRSEYPSLQIREKKTEEERGGQGKKKEDSIKILTYSMSRHTEKKETIFAARR